MVGQRQLFVEGQGILTVFDRFIMRANVNFNILLLLFSFFLGHHFLGKLEYCY